MKDKIAPNMRAFESSPGRMSELFQSGEVVAAVWGSSRVAAVRGDRVSAEIRLPEGGHTGAVRHRLRGEGCA